MTPLDYPTSGRPNAASFQDSVFHHPVEGECKPLSYKD